MQLSKETLSKSLTFYRESSAFSGVNKIADKVRNDFLLVFDVFPNVTFERNKLTEMAVIYGTVDRSPILDDLFNAGKIDLDQIRDKNEVYLFKVVSEPLPNIKQALIIAGSDKRGTIYGLFHLSELIGVSPLVNFSDVVPQKKKQLEIRNDLLLISKEPSVRFRGFFINDEWPAFGNWCKKRFGGFNAEAYENVFELLLRLKGNYLWPAMWSGRFMDDGPGLLNAELADEYGVVMGMSHHEPCLRQGEEYKYLRGKDSPYGDAWNFRVNEEGITKFWEDGLKRSGKFENVITVGMRGEADTAIMGKNATLADNIELLRDVLRTQRRLIQEYVNEDLSKVPRMIALYKEVEEFFYGNEEAKGLMGCEELEDVILMLCDDNFGNLRTLPTEEMRSHKGGYGMYYHFDYHGWPISYEWINTSFLPKIWEQMTAAYDFGVRDLWIVNVGDICTQEFPLSFFLDLAYDFDQWGTKGLNRTEEYTRKWINTQFGGKLSEEELTDIFTILRGYTKMTSRRRTEALNASIFHPVNYRESENMLDEIDTIISKAENIYSTISKELLPSFVELVYYPAVGNLNVFRMQIYTGLNHYLAEFGAMEANNYISKIRECMARDRELVDLIHTIDSGKWYGMGMSEHIGFTNWNEDECKNPVLMQVLPADKERVRLVIEGSGEHAEGSFWLKNTLQIDDFLNPNTNEAFITLYNISDLKTNVTVYSEVPWLDCSSERCVLDGEQHAKCTIKISLNRIKLPKNEERVAGEIYVELPAGKVTIQVPVLCAVMLKFPKMTFVDTIGYVCIEAEHFYRKGSPSSNAAFEVLSDYGKTLSAIKAFPAQQEFTPGENAPYVEYHFDLPKSGDYEVQFYLQPSNAATIENRLTFGFSINGGDIVNENTIPANTKVGDNQHFWGDGVLNNIRIHKAEMKCKEGENLLRLYAATPGFVLEKLVIYPKGKAPIVSYLGPQETYFI